MPLTYQQNISQSGKIAWWKIEEPMHFFSPLITLPNYIHNAEKQLEFLASRQLMCTVAKIEPTQIENIQNEKPIIKNVKFNFSLSHTKDWAVFALTDIKNPCGVDIEHINDRAEKISAKFLNTFEVEQAEKYFTHNAELYTSLWAAKETVYKAVMQKGLSFKNDIEIINIEKIKSNKLVIVAKAKQITYNVQLFLGGGLVTGVVA